MRILIVTKRRHLDLEFGPNDADDEAQPRGDVYASTERAHEQAAPELDARRGIGFRMTPDARSPRVAHRLGGRDGLDALSD